MPQSVYVEMEAKTGHQKPSVELEARTTETQGFIEIAAGVRWKMV